MSLILYDFWSYIVLNVLCKLSSLLVNRDSTVYLSSIIELTLLILSYITISLDTYNENL